MYLLLTAAQLPNFVAVVSSPCCLWIFALKKNPICHFEYYQIAINSGAQIEEKKTQLLTAYQFSSVQFSRSVVSECLWPHELQHARPPCLSPTPGVHSDSCPSSQWCHPAISSSVVPFSSCPQSLQRQSLFQWVNSLHEVAKVLEFQLQHHSLQGSPRADLLQNGLAGSPWLHMLQCKSISKKMAGDLRRAPSLGHKGVRRGIPFS